jgi:hypothetical protein
MVSLSHKEVTEICLHKKVAEWVNVYIEKKLLAEEWPTYQQWIVETDQSRRTGQSVERIHPARRKS